MDVIPVSDQASKVQRCRRAADLERINNLKIASYLRGTPSNNGSLGPPHQASKWHLDRFSCFCRAQPCAQHTDTQTMLHATSVAIGRIYAVQCSLKTKKSFTNKTMPSCRKADSQHIHLHNLRRQVHQCLDHSL